VAEGCPAPCPIDLQLQLSQGFARSLDITQSLTPHDLESHDHMSAPYLLRSTPAPRPINPQLHLQLGQGFERSLNITQSLTPHDLERHDHVSTLSLPRSTCACFWVSKAVSSSDFALGGALDSWSPTSITSNDVSYHSKDFPSIENPLPPNPDARANSFL
jgi:hypothetical protein